MTPTPAQRKYWRKTLHLTGSLLLVWCLLTFAGGYYAAELNRFEFFGFPLGFYLFAQGALIAFLIIIAIYVKRMQTLDECYLREATPPLSQMRPPNDDE